MLVLVFPKKSENYVTLCYRQSLFIVANKNFLCHNNCVTKNININFKIFPTWNLSLSDYERNLLVPTLSSNYRLTT